MAVARLGTTKKLRRLVTMQNKAGGPVEMDVTITSKGLSFRYPGQKQRQRLVVSWDDVFINAHNSVSGYRVRSIGEAIAHLMDADAKPEDCPCCGTKNAWAKRKKKKRRAARKAKEAADELAGESMAAQAGVL